MVKKHQKERKHFCTPFALKNHIFLHLLLVIICIPASKIWPKFITHLYAGCFSVPSATHPDAGAAVTHIWKCGNWGGGWAIGLRPLKSGFLSCSTTHHIHPCHHCGTWAQGELMQYADAHPAWCTVSNKLSFVSVQELSHLLPTSNKLAGYPVHLQVG